MFKTGVKVKVVSPTKNNRIFNGLVGEVISCTTNSLNDERLFCVEFTSHPRVIYGFFKDSELAYADSSTYQAAMQAFFESMYGISKTTMGIKNVIFHDPATIVYWMDGSKTVVKCQSGDIFDPEKGLAMAIAKRVYGDNGRYFGLFKKWIPDSDEIIVLDLGQEFADSLKKAASAAAATFSTFGSALKKKGE
jgi:hypothetical protein|nr:MAG TPA: hypothetical protein [Caudoviricetes sp.]